MPAGGDSAYFSLYLRGLSLGLLELETWCSSSGSIYGRTWGKPRVTRFGPSCLRGQQKRNIVHRWLFWKHHFFLNRCFCQCYNQSTEYHWASKITKWMLTYLFTYLPTYNHQTPTPFDLTPLTPQIKILGFVALAHSCSQYWRRIKQVKSQSRTSLHTNRNTPE